MKRKLSSSHEDVDNNVDSLLNSQFNIDTRLKLILTCLTNNKNDWKSLERDTGIAAEKWRQYTRGTTKASVSMLDAVGKTWPQYAFWLMTGVSDERHGHHPPNQIWAFPNFDPHQERRETKTGVEDNYEKTTSYFKHASKLATELWPLGGPFESFNYLGKVDKTSTTGKSSLELEIKGKWGTARKTNKRLAADLDLLQTLASLKEREFLLNNPNLDEQETE